MIPLRGAIEQRVGRMRELGVRGALTIERITLLRLVKSTIAATIAYQAGELINSPRPVLAALGAILVVQVTVRASFARSIQLTIAVTLGLIATLLLGHVFGIHWWSIALVVLGGLIVGELLRLGAFSTQVAISALLALSLGGDYGYQRAVDTALGAVIGVAVNALISPPSYVQEASQSLRRVGDDLGALLRDLSTGIVARPDAAAIQRWLARAREISAQVRRAEQTIGQGEESVRFNHRAHGDWDTLERLGEGRVAMEHVTSQVRGIVRALVDLDDELADPNLAALLSALGELLADAAGQVSSFGRLTERPDSDVDRERAIRAHADALLARDRAVHALRDLPSTESDENRLVASVLVDAERLLTEVDVEHGSHVRAIATG